MLNYSLSQLNAFSGQNNKILKLTKYAHNVLKNATINNIFLK